MTGPSCFRNLHHFHQNEWYNKQVLFPLVSTGHTFVLYIHLCLTTWILLSLFQTDVYYVEYYGNGAESGIMDKSVFAYNLEESLSKNEYEKRGYHAEDKRTWTTQADGSGNSYADTQKHLPLKRKNLQHLYLLLQSHFHLVLCRYTKGE